MRTRSVKRSKLQIVALVLVFASGCARKATVPQAPAPSFSRSAPTTGPIVRFSERQRRIGIEAVQTKTAKLCLSFFPAGMTYDLHGLDLLKASGFDCTNYWNDLATLAAALDTAGPLGLEIDLAWQASAETVDWIVANVAPFPNRIAALGLFAVSPDEPNPSTCAVGSACHNAIISLYNYA